MSNWKLIGTLMVSGAIGHPLVAWSDDYYGRSGGDFVIEAPVTRVEPLVSIVTVATPQETCWDEPVYQARHPRPRVGPVVAGGIFGGLLGNVIGKGRSSRSALTAVGAAVGASIGYHESRKNAPPQTTYVTQQRVCEIRQVTHEEERIDGYRVTYEYRGRSFVTQTATDPGPTIRVRVNVQPVAYNESGYSVRPSSRSRYRSPYSYREYET